MKTAVLIILVAGAFVWLAVTTSRILVAENTARTDTWKVACKQVGGVPALNPSNRWECLGVVVRESK